MLAHDGKHSVIHKSKITGIALATPLLGLLPVLSFSHFPEAPPQAARAAQGQPGSDPTQALPPLPLAALQRPNEGK